MWPRVEARKECVLINGAGTREMDMLTLQYDSGETQIRSWCWRELGYELLALSHIHA